METPAQQSNRPVQITAAVALMYGVVALGILRTGMTVMRHIDVRTPYFFIGVKALLYALSIFLIYNIGKGRNWAKWALMAVLVAAIPLGVLPTIDSFAHNPLHAMLGYGQLAAWIIAAVLLFQQASSDWLRSGSA